MAEHGILLGTSDGLQRESGIALWRQIADRIHDTVIPATGGSGARIPAEQQLAEKFGVNRHTVRAAISALVREGVLRSERGRGTFIEKQRRLTYPISSRTRFSAAMDGQAGSIEGRLLAHRNEPATASVARELEIQAESPVLRLETLSSADGTPLSRGTAWYDAIRLPKMAEVFERTGSITAAFAEHGIEDYYRRQTVVEARHADPSDQRDLSLASGAIVFVTRYVSCDTAGIPIQYAETRFPADRIQLRFGEE